MKIVTKTLALSVFMLPALALAEAVGGMGEILIYGILMLAGVYLILLPYVMTRLVYWIYVVICLVSGKKTEKLNSGWILLDIVMFSLAGYWYISFVLLPERESRERERLKELSQITLPAPQTVAGITMPAGTYIETNIAERTHSEPDKFTYAKFPQPVVWNGIPITSIKRRMFNDYNYWTDYAIQTNSEKPARIGQWLCAGKGLEWGLLPQANGKPPEIPYNQSVEPYVYLSSCFLEKVQTASLPEFGAMFKVRFIRRENDKYRNIAKGFWRTGASGYSEESRESGKMDFRSLGLSVDTARVVHEFAAKLEDNPDMNCQMPEHTFLVWQKSRPNVILAASPEPKRIPKKCWGKTLVPTPFEVLSKQLGPNYETFFAGEGRYFEQTQAASSL